MQRLSSKDVLRADQFGVDEIDRILEAARRYEAVLDVGEVLDELRGKILATLFFEPSTRTRLSFEAAMLRLGGRVISVAEGAGQHPTQSLLDLYTIVKEQGRVDGLTIALAGDLKNGRTVHSLADLLANYDVEFVFAAPDALRMPHEIVERLRASGIPIRETESLVDAIQACDVLYMTRIQRERFDDPSEYERLKDAYVLSRDMLSAARESITIMHPLPRVNEIATDVDDHSGAAYFRQAANGVPIRMALLALVTR